MLKTTVFLTLILACANAEASVGLLLTPIVPEASETQVLVIRDGTMATVATRTLGSNDERIFPIYPNMKNVRVGNVPAAAFEALNQTTSPTLERWVERDPCGPEPSPTTRANPTLASTGAGSNAKPLKLADLKKNLGTSPLSEEQLSALEHEEKLGAKFLVLKSEAGQVASVTYDAELLELPTRLGQLNQSKTQHLRVFVVAAARFEVSNFWMSYLPTNIELRPETKSLVEVHQSVVSKSDEQKLKAFWVEFAGVLTAPDSRVITRLSHSSAAGKLDDNLTLSPTNPLVGGTSDNKAGAFGGETNDFRIRYFSNQKFTGSVACAKPVRDRWQKVNVESADAWPTDAPSMDLGPVVLAPIPEIYVSPVAPQAPVVAESEPVEPVAPKAVAPKPGCSLASSPNEGAWFLSILLGWFFVRRRK